MSTRRQWSASNRSMDLATPAGCAGAGRDGPAAPAAAGRRNTRETAAPRSRDVPGGKAHGFIAATSADGQASRETHQAGGNAGGIDPDNHTRLRGALSRDFL